MKVGQYVTQKYLSAKMDKNIDGLISVIDAVFSENINSVDKLVMRIKGCEKPMVLNQTNLNALILAFGDDTDTWINKKIEIRVVGVMFNGALVDGLQVKPIK